MSIKLSYFALGFRVSPELIAVYYPLLREEPMRFHEEENELDDGRFYAGEPEEDEEDEISPEDWDDEWDEDEEDETEWEDEEEDEDEEDELRPEDQPL